MLWRIFPDQFGFLCGCGWFVFILVWALGVFLGGRCQGWIGLGLFYKHEGVDGVP